MLRCATYVYTLQLMLDVHCLYCNDVLYEGGLAYFLVQPLSYGLYTASNCGGPSIIGTQQMQFGYTAVPRLGYTDLQVIINHHEHQSIIGCRISVWARSPRWRCRSLLLYSLYTMCIFRDSHHIIHQLLINRPILSAQVVD